MWMELWVGLFALLGIGCIVIALWLNYHHKQPRALRRKALRLVATQWGINPTKWETDAQLRKRILHHLHGH